MNTDIAANRDERHGSRAALGLFQSIASSRVAASLGLATALVSLGTAIVSLLGTCANTRRIDALETCPPNMPVWISTPGADSEIFGQRVIITGQAAPHASCRYVFVFTGGPGRSARWRLADQTQTRQGGAWSAAAEFPEVGDAGRELLRIQVRVTADPGDYAWGQGYAVLPEKGAGSDVLQLWVRPEGASE
jgi:hypothetical protein